MVCFICLTAYQILMDYLMLKFVLLIKLLGNIFIKKQKWELEEISFVMNYVDMIFLRCWYWVYMKGRVYEEYWHHRAVSDLKMNLKITKVFRWSIHRYIWTSLLVLVVIVTTIYIYIYMCVCIYIYIYIYNLNKVCWEWFYFRIYKRLLINFQECLMYDNI